MRSTSRASSIYGNYHMKVAEAAAAILANPDSILDYLKKLQASLG